MSYYKHRSICKHENFMCQYINTKNNNEIDDPGYKLIYKKISVF